MARFAVKYDFDTATTGLHEGSGQILRGAFEVKSIEPENTNVASGEGHESNTGNQEEPDAPQE